MADFGLSESIDTSKQYFRQDKEVVVKLPIKWLAPESINESVFSEKTDVVSNCISPYLTIQPLLYNYYSGMHFISSCENPCIIVSAIRQAMHMVL